jgi:hypothetical protein
MCGVGHAPVSSAGARRVDREANASETSPAVAAAAAGDVEGHGHYVALLDMQHVAADFDDFPRDFVTQDEAGGCSGAAADLARVVSWMGGGGGSGRDGSGVACLFLLRELVVRI